VNPFAWRGRIGYPTWRTGIDDILALDWIVSYDATIMSNDTQLKNHVKALRQKRQWSQANLASRAGISRTAVSAIEGNRLVPSVFAALALARVLDCTVEELFGESIAGDQPHWAWSPHNKPCRFWQAEVGGRSLMYPAEATPLGVMPHDGVCESDGMRQRGKSAPQSTIVMASCDPAASMLASECARLTNFRLLVFPRSSQRALDLVADGLVHVGGVHLSTPREPERNLKAARATLGDCCLVRLARWQEGITFSSRCDISSVRAAIRSRLSWVGREPGSGAGQCLDELLQGRSRPRFMAYDHRGVAEAVRSGWADAGVCHRLVSEEAGLRFLPVREEAFDLCFPAQLENDPRIQALMRVVRSAAYRRLLNELPGYDATDAGDCQYTS
jgi:molybdate-binding protein/DNA-binding XRE family transcriptional regulator